MNIISEQFHFFQFVNMYILRYDRYSMAWFIKMEKNLLYVNYLLCGHLESKYNIYEDRTHANLDEQTQKVCYSLKSNKYILNFWNFNWFIFWLLFLMLWYSLVQEPPIQLNWAWSYILCCTSPTAISFLREGKMMSVETITPSNMRACKLPFNSFRMYHWAELQVMGPTVGWNYLCRPEFLDL